MSRILAIILTASVCVLNVINLWCRWQVSIDTFILASMEPLGTHLKPFGKYVGGVVLFMILHFHRHAVDVTNQNCPFLPWTAEPHIPIGSNQEERSVVCVNPDIQSPIA